MTKVQYKNWKTEIAWLRRVANVCRKHSEKYAKSPELSDTFSKLATILDERANYLDVARGAVQQ